jgi:two-component system, chemotaxis family, sensor kinase CheA
MSPLNQKQLESLASIMQILANVGPGDQQEVMQAGAMLEDAVDAFEGRGSQLNRLIDLAWEGLKHLYERDDFFMTVKMATLQAVNTIREYAENNGNIDVAVFEKSCAELQKALDGSKESADWIIELSDEQREEYEQKQKQRKSEEVVADASVEVTEPEVAEAPEAEAVATPVEAPDAQVVDSAGADAPVILSASDSPLDDLNAYFMTLDEGEVSTEQFVRLRDMLMRAANGESSQVAEKLAEAALFASSGAKTGAQGSLLKISASLEQIVELKMEQEWLQQSNSTVDSSSSDSSHGDSESPATGAGVSPKAEQSSAPAVAPANETASAVAPKPIKPVSVSIEDPHGGPATYTIPEESDAELLQEFYTECSELISLAEGALLDLENSPDDDELINQVFRSFHTIKGTSAFLGLQPISEFAHSTETVLSMVREDELSYSAECADAVLGALDTIKSLVESTLDKGAGDIIPIPAAYYALNNLMHEVAENGSFEVEAIAGLSKVEATAATSVEAPPPLSSNTEEVSDSNGVVASSEPDWMDDDGAADDMLIQAAAQVSGEDDVDLDTKSGSMALEASRRNTNTNGSAKGGPRSEGESTVRVNTDRLDRLIDTVGELVIAHSVVAQDGIVASDNDLQRKVTHASKILRELQDISLKLRMVPMKATFQKMNRLVRDLGRKAGKNVAFKTAGEDTEIDRNMVDVINEPLVHMLRNSIDHGVELPDQRVAAGKEPTATVYLRAFQQGGKVVIEIEDDGRGLNTEKIYAKALSKGLLDANKHVTDNEIHNLIFLPGFSTADQVTDLSGRGVGMDVVRRSIDQLQGKVDVFSETGRGTRVSIELPFTLAITDGMLIRVAEQRFIVPTINIDMTFRPQEKDRFTIMGSSEKVMFRGSAIPVIRLYQMFGIPGAVEDVMKGVLLVINSNKNKYALLIDEVLGQQHLVGKSINMPVKLHNVSGGAILGDGRVGLILDTMTLVN